MTIPHALVTGGSSGIGAASAALLREGGYEVSILDISADHPCDVSDWNDAKKGIETAVANNGPIQSIVHCAGIDPLRATVAELEPSEWARILSVNLTGTFHVCRASIPHLADGASIAICGSVLGSVALEGVAAYSASKSGLHGLVRVLALELADRPIRVNLIEPAAVRTPMLEATLHEKLGPDADTSQYGQDRRVGRPIKPQDVARILVWLAGAGSYPLTGTVIPVDTGLTARAAL